MSVSRLLRAERLARKTTPREAELSYEDAVRLANEGRVPVWAPLPPPEEPIELPTPVPPPPVEAKAEPPAPEQPRAWHEDYCWWRARTSADDAKYAENDHELDDPLGIYS